MQHYSCDVTPVGAFSVRVEQAQIGDNVLLVVNGQNGIGGRGIGDIGIKGRHPHGHSRDDSIASFALDRWQIDDPMRAGHPPRPAHQRSRTGWQTGESGCIFREDDGPRRQDHVRAAPPQSWAGMARRGDLSDGRQGAHHRLQKRGRSAGVDEKRPLRGLGKGAGLRMTDPKRPRDNALRFNNGIGRCQIISALCSGRATASFCRMPEGSHWKRRRALDWGARP